MEECGRWKDPSKKKKNSRTQTIAWYLQRWRSWVEMEEGIMGINGNGKMQWKINCF